MKVLVINCGSSSLKYQVIDMDNTSVLAKGNFQRIGEKESFLEHKINGNKYVIKEYVKTHEQALKCVFHELLNKSYPAISDLSEINAVGHRIVHGGEYFSTSAVITEEVIQKITECGKFAPLHNFAAVQGIRACKELLGDVPMVAVFDTAFHQTMPKERFLYPIPYEYYEKYRVRKYGAHGTSHDYVSRRVGAILGKTREELKIITCHLGQGASICAIDKGKSVDTSMGLTPLGGIAMVTRSGDLDPSVVTYIMEKENISPDAMTDILNKKSGISAMCQMVPDFRAIEETSVNEKNIDAALAVEKFVVTVAEYIARYAAVLNGVDVIVFTGGIGENQTRVRKAICNKLSFMGVDLNEEKNLVKGEECEITTPDSKVKAFVIPTDEELEIAKETVRLSF